MRTTINIDDELLRAAKIHAAKIHAAKMHKTLSKVIEDALRLALADKSTQRPNRPAEIPTSGSGGLQPGVDLGDMSSVLERMEGAEPGPAGMPALPVAAPREGDTSVHGE